jgi:hypothetical protein
LTFATRMDAMNCKLLIPVSSTITDQHLYSKQASTCFEEQADPCESLLICGNSFCSCKELRIFFGCDRRW